MKHYRILVSLVIAALCLMPAAAQAPAPTAALTVEQMSWTGPDKAVHANSVWEADQFNVSFSTGTAVVTFCGWDTAAAMQAKYAGQPVTPIGQHQYTVSGTAFWTILPQLLGGSAALAPTILGLTATQDVDTGTKDANGVEVYTSFFATATQGTVTVTPPVSSGS